MKNKTVVITGAGSGIGKACALKFAASGASLVLVGRTESKLQQVATEIKKLYPVQIQIHTVDLASEKNTQDLWNQIKDFDIAINNAGIEGALGEITKLSLKDFDEVTTINLRALWHCLREEVRILQTNKHPGSIVNVSSIAGLRGIPRSALYVASKHAVNGLTKSLALEQICHGIRINAVCPGGIETPMLERIFSGDLTIPAQFHPIGRNGKPYEIADAIYWLASEASSFVVGQCLPVDGGRTSS